jgi:hypothetical protein
MVALPLPLVEALSSRSRHRRSGGEHGSIGTSALLVQGYREVMINPGSQRVEGATIEQAEHNLQAFIDSASDRGLELADEPERLPDADKGGRYGWTLRLAGGEVVQVLMPGVDLVRVRDDLSAEAPCLKINGDWWWWNGAVDAAVPAAASRRQAGL